MSENEKETNCEIHFHFGKHLECHYHYYNGTFLGANYFTFDYPKLFQILDDGLFVQYFIPIQKLHYIGIALFDVLDKHTQYNAKISKIIQHITNNVDVNEIGISIESDIELNLSQIKMCKKLVLCDPFGLLPKEYLHHLVKLLENKQTKIIMFKCNINGLTIEDFEVFENINSTIKHNNPYIDRIVYDITLKD
jgi:hypothetical protein